MPGTLEVLFTPAEFAALGERDLSRTICVVFDVLRATSTMVTALANGAEAIVPVAEIADALAIRQRRPEVLLAGERDGVRIRTDLTGGVEFDLGNSPREFTRQRVQGKTIVMTTTNGTRALWACRKAKTTLIGSFLNLRSLADRMSLQGPDNLLLLCGGTQDEAAYEDILGAGAFCDLVWSVYVDGRVADSALVARHLYRHVQNDLLGAVQHSRNAQRLLANPELREDVNVCLQRDVVSIVAGLDKNGLVRKLP